MKNISLELVRKQLSKKYIYIYIIIRITQNLKKSVFPSDKKNIFNIFNISAQIEETETTVNSDKDWKISHKTEEISVRQRLKENNHFGENELKRALFVQNIINNGYIIPFIKFPHRFTPHFK